MVEHRHTLHTMQRSKPGSGGTVKQTLHMFCCTCGHHTGWRVRLADARRLRDRHALDGQLSQP